MLNHLSQNSTLAGRTLLRTSLAAAMLFPLAHPALAAHSFGKALPNGTRFQQARLTAANPAAMFRKQWAHRSTKNGGHFHFPYGLAADALGNVFVANSQSNTVAMISPKLKATDGVITQQLNGPASVAVGADQTIFVGNLGVSGGYVERYSGSTPQQTITANAAAPYDIAADQFNDLYVVYNGGIALDDPSGNSLYGPEYQSYGIFSVAVGNANVYGFVNNDVLMGSGSVFLRSGMLQSIFGPTNAAEPVGAACGNGMCWFSDAGKDTINILATNAISTGILNYSPAGVAYDRLHNRIFVADPQNNAVHIYNAQTLALEKNIT
ncbi:MAG: hypothetical protein JO043_07565 [Candidatus Eremiobacteraeota bacterium]|nr:hypothetical protein [Candidatus Eremiobacteraeota bacterium]